MTTQTRRPRRRSKANEALPALRRFSADEYERMGEAGIIHEDERVELLEGAIICMAPIGVPHAICLRELSWWFSRRLPETTRFRVQDPIRLSSSSEPQPDFVIVPYRPELDAGGHPGPQDVLLLVEVSDTTLAYDRGVKLPLYAVEGIGEVWIIDLTAQQVLAFRAPQDGRYTETLAVGRDGTIAPLAFPDLALPPAILFGQAGR
jgi:Uma2 family endonuclease